MTQKRLLLATLIITGNLATGSAASSSTVREAVVATEGAARAALITELEGITRDDDVVAFKAALDAHGDSSVIFWECFSMDLAIRYYAAAIIEHVLELNPERVKEKMPSGKTMRREFNEWHAGAVNEFVGRAAMHADNDEYDRARLDSCDRIAESIAKAEAVRAEKRRTERAAKKAVAGEDQFESEWGAATCRRVSPVAGNQKASRCSAGFDDLKYF